MSHPISMGDSFFFAKMYEKRKSLSIFKLQHKKKKDLCFIKRTSKIRERN